VNIAKLPEFAGAVILVAAELQAINPVVAFFRQQFQAAEHNRSGAWHLWRQTKKSPSSRIDQVIKTSVKSAFLTLNSVCALAIANFGKSKLGPYNQRFAIAKCPKMARLLTVAANVD
jgi:hypothetical protein